MMSIFNRALRRRVFLFVSIIAACSSVTVIADTPRVYENDQRPNDARYEALKTLNGYFPFTPPTSKDDWAKRRDFARRQVQLACGLWPLPTKTDLNARIHGETFHGDYGVAKVYFESYPGHYVTGSLYQPLGASLNRGVKNGKRPAILCPHGHWANGRFYDAGEANAKKLIAARDDGPAAEFSIDSARAHIQARCVQLARMGCIVFHFDMEGYADSVQFAHRPGVRQHMNTKENWGFFSPQAELRLQSMFGLQTWNCVRALDFVSGLNGVDQDRLAVTGASGGGTQTMILAAIDDRIDLAVPAVMVSTAMQGGCTCENANYLRLNSGNIEFAALFAPRPQALIAADDWTKELMTRGYPELEKTYELLGEPDNLAAIALLQFGHNYNYPNRQFLYAFLNEHFDLGLDEPIVERDFERLTKEQLTVWNDKHPAPPSGDEHERELVRHMTMDSDAQLAALNPKDARSLAAYRRIVGGALEVMIGRRFDQIGEIKWELTYKQDRGDYFVFAGKLRSVSFNEELPAAFFMAKNWNKQVVVWVDPDGKSAIFNDDGGPAPPIKELLDGGFAVAAADLFMQGEFLPPGQNAEKARIQHYGDGRNPWHHYTGYTFGYNHALFAQRVHDIMTLVSFVWQYEGRPPQQVHLVGADGAGKWVGAAAALMGEKISKVAIHTGGFTFAALDRFDHPDFLPGAVKYGDVAGMIALIAPHPLLLSGADGAVVKRAYEAQDRAAALKAAAPADWAARVAPWLMN